MAAMAVVLGCGGFAALTAARAFGVSSSGPLNVCLDRGIPPGDAGALSTSFQWLPMGIRCEWTTRDGVVVDGPPWSDTLVVTAVTLVGVAVVVALFRYDRRSAG